MKYVIQSNYDETKFIDCIDSNKQCNFNSGQVIYTSDLDVAAIFNSIQECEYYIKAYDFDQSISHSNHFIEIASLGCNKVEEVQVVELGDYDPDKHDNRGMSWVNLNNEDVFWSDDQGTISPNEGSKYGVNFKSCNNYKSDIESQVIDDILERQKLGINKYGTTLANNPLALKPWLIHAYEESLDYSLYLKRAIQEIDNMEMGK